MPLLDSCRLDMSAEWICKLEDISIEISKTEGEKKTENSKHNIQELWDDYKRYSISCNGNLLLFSW